MKTQYYHKRDITKLRRCIQFFGLFLFLSGIFGLIYVFYPLLAWQMYLAPEFASQAIAAPIPNKSILADTSITSLLQSTMHTTDPSNAADWYPNYVPQPDQQTSGTHTYFLSIPSLGIHDAVVSDADNDLDHHLVNFAGTGVPPEKGNPVIFGHSTLEQWFDPHNYKAIFATLINIQIGDKITVTVNGADYTYITDNITVVDADDTSPLAQQYDDSYLTIITCTPPGTTWKRLVVHSHLEKLTNTSLQ